jgi:hypothetical protein
MGLVKGEVRFPGDPPSLEAIAERVTARCGLRAVAEPLEDYDGFYQLHGRVGFACAPETAVKVYCYSPQQRQRNVELFVEAGLVSPEAQKTPLRPGSVVHLKSFIGVEPTLLFQTELALEELGGTLREPFPEDMRREYGGPLTEAELLRRIEEMQASMRPIAAAASALFGPQQIFSRIAELAELLVRSPQFPKTIEQAQKLLRERGGFPFPLSDQEDVSEGITYPPREEPPPS